MWILQSDWLIRLEIFFFILDNLGWIVPSQTYSFANDKFKQSNEIIVIKIEESLIVVVKIKL